SPSEPLVWPALTKPQSGIRSFAGHTDTVLDVIGRIGAPPSVVIFTEGNHLMVLLSDDIIGAFPSWAKSQPEYADLNIDNIVVSTLPQPILIEAIRAGGIALGITPPGATNAFGINDKGNIVGQFTSANNTTGFILPSNASAAFTTINQPTGITADVIN